MLTWTLKKSGRERVGRVAMANDRLSPPTYMTPTQARALAHKLLDAATDAESEIEPT